jgi:uncharacterized membrane protein
MLPNNNRSTKSPNRIIIGSILFLIIIIAFFLRFYDIGKLSFWQDELFTAGFTKVSLRDLAPAIWQKEIHMSAFLLLTGLWARLPFNASEGMLRSLSAIFSILSIPVVFFLARSMSANRQRASIVGLISAFLIAINAFSIEYAQELRAYSLVFLLTGLSTLLLITAVKKHSPVCWISYTLVTATAIYSHFFAIFILAAQIISLFVFLKNNIRSFPFKGFSSSLIAISILSIPLIIAVRLEEKKDMGWIPALSFNQILEFFMEITGYQGIVLATLCVTLAMAGIIIAFTKASKQKDIYIKWKTTLAVLCLILPITLTVLISLVQPLFVNRYLIFILPYLEIFVAESIVCLMYLNRFKNKTYFGTPISLIFNYIGLFTLLSLTILSSVGIKNYFTATQKEDYRGVSKLMSKNCLNSLRLYFPLYVQIGGYGIYYNNNLYSQFPTWQNMLDKNATPESIAKRLPNNYNRVCLMIGNLFPETIDIARQLTLIRKALQIKYPGVAMIKFYILEVDIYQR